MRCPNCSTENLPNANLCKNCGAVLRASGVKVCPNGHNYRADLPECPYCPGANAGQAETIAFSGQGSSQAETVVSGGGRPVPVPPGGNEAPTVISGGAVPPASVDRTAIVGSPSAPPSDRTQIVIPGQANPPADHTHGAFPPVAPVHQAQAPQADMRKLVGWLVSFDLQPTGLDFRLYVGKNKLGRNPKCDIVINKGWISDEHAMILYREDRFLLQDMMSANGTYVNDVLIEDRIYLNDNDMVRLGNTTFKFKAL